MWRNKAMEKEKPDSLQDPDLLKRSWTPFRLCPPDTRDPESDIYLNSRYQVHRRRITSPAGGPDLVHLSLKRVDRRILIPYEDKLRIKNEVVAPECEGVELLPARSREIDTANQYHLWVIDSAHFRFPLRTDAPFSRLEWEAEAAEQDLLTAPWTPLCPIDKDQEGIIYRNSRYQLCLQRFATLDGAPAIIRLYCQRLDGNPLIPYRDRMRIKDELAGAECEGIELLPARSRAVATMPGCILWIIDDTSFRFPFGFAERCVSECALDGAVQEPWPPEERPADCLSENELRAWLRNKSDLRFT
jgi:hypothetical protein